MATKVKSLSLKERIPYYYRIIGKFKDAGEKKINATEIANLFGFKARSTVSQNLMEIVGKAGKKRYGYNIAYMYSELQQILSLDSPCYAYTVGTIFPFMESEEIKRRNIFITNNEEEIIRLLIVTDDNTKDITDILEKHPEIEYIINFTTNKYVTGNIPLLNFDFLEILLASLKIADYEIISDEV